MVQASNYPRPTHYTTGQQQYDTLMTLSSTNLNLKAKHLPLILKSKDLPYSLFSYTCYSLFVLYIFLYFAHEREDWPNWLSD
jgi:hypothetical protein